MADWCGESMLCWWQLEESSNRRRVKGWWKAVRMENVAGHELWRSHGESCEISQQSTKGLSICHPGTVHQVQRDGAGTAGSVLRAFSAAGMGQLFAPCGIPDRDSSLDGLWLWAATDRAFQKMLKGLAFVPASTARGVCRSWVGTEGRWSQPAGRGMSAEGGRVDPGTGVIKETWV